MDRPTNAVQESEAPAVVVGVDGSTIGLEAVRWAVGEAMVRGLPLRILHAAPYTRGQNGPARRHAEGILARAFTIARRAQPELTVSTELTADDPARSLLDVTTRARLLVVGMGGGERAFEALMTSVALDVSSHASCPVVVVRMPTAHYGERRDVVVGVVAPDDDAAAVEVAFADARRHGDGVLVLHAHHRPFHEHGGGRHPDDDAVAARLTDELAPWRRRYPEVPVRVDAVAGSPASELLTASVAARLVVVGTRRRSATARVLLGSTSRQVIRRCPTPVVVVDPEVTLESVRAESEEAATPSSAPSSVPKASRQESHDQIELR